MFDNAGLTCGGGSLPEVGAGAAPAAADSVGTLLLRVRDADRPAFRKLYDMTAPRLLAKAMSILGSRDAAEDAMQEAYVRIWRNARQFDPARGSASAWILRILRNAAIDRLRQDRMIARYQCSDEAAPELPIAPEPVTDRLDLQRSLALLTPEQRTTICRVVVEGWTHEEVALADQVPTPTAKARAQRGLVRLRTVLTETEGGARPADQWEKAVA